MIRAKLMSTDFISTERISRMRVFHENNTRYHFQCSHPCPFLLVVYHKWKHPSKKSQAQDFISQTIDFGTHVLYTFGIFQSHSCVSLNSSSWMSVSRLQTYRTDGGMVMWFTSGSNMTVSHLFLFYKSPSSHFAVTRMERTRTSSIFIWSSHFNALSDFC